MKITETSHKAGGAGLGGALAAVIVWFADQQGIDMGPIAEPIAMILTVLIFAAGGAWLAPRNQPRVPTS